MLREIKKYYLSFLHKKTAPGYFDSIHHKMLSYRRETALQGAL